MWSETRRRCDSDAKNKSAQWVAKTSTPGSGFNRKQRVNPETEGKSVPDDTNNLIGCQTRVTPRVARGLNTSY